MGHMIGDSLVDDADAPLATGVQHDATSRTPMAGRMAQVLADSDDSSSESRDRDSHRRSRAGPSHNKVRQRARRTDEDDVAQHPLVFRERRAVGRNRRGLGDGKLPKTTSSSAAAAPQLPGERSSSTVEEAIGTHWSKAARV